MRILVSGTTASLRRLLPTWADSLGFLLGPRGGNAMETVSGMGIPWACDNDCFQGLNEPRYRRMLAKVTNHPGCLFVTAPDVVGDARVTLNLWAEWYPLVASTGQPVASVGQDGIEGLPVPWSELDAWFIGGSTEWKLSQASADLATEAKRRGKWVHMGRVNSFRRLMSAWDMGCDSVDGTKTSRYETSYLAKFCRFLGQMRQQQTLFGATQ